jgi:5'-AMP-activated protein kinase regulatory gamma subunit
MRSRFTPETADFSVAGVVSAPLWNSEKSVFAGMFTVSDIIHLIQYYYHTSSYDNAAADVETFRLESLRGMNRPFDAYSMKR